MSKVLIIEPDRLLAKTYIKALETNSTNSVDAAYGAQEAIEVMDKDTPQLIILELQLGEHNGIEFLYEIRSYSDWQSIPVVIFSRLSEKESNISPDNKRQLGITAYCYKPHTSLVDLQKIVRKQIEITHET